MSIENLKTFGKLFRHPTLDTIYVEWQRTDIRLTSMMGVHLFLFEGESRCSFDVSFVGLVCSLFSIAVLAG